MTQFNKDKKPFGLSLACNIAAKAINDNAAPASIILGNLLFLQQSTSFPKDLDSSFFIVSKKLLSDNEKRVISALLPEIKKPLFQIPIILEKAIQDNWVRKIPQKEDKGSLKNNFNKSKVNNLKKTVNINAVKPTVIIKRNKLT
jgi:hypothetical protein